MTVVTQLDPPIAVDTELGDGYAVLVETHSDDQFWTVILNNSRAFVTFPQKKIRAKRSFTCGRDLSTEIMKELLARGGFHDAAAPVSGIVQTALASCCYSAIKPCLFQQRHPENVCFACQQAQRDAIPVRGTHA